MTEQSKTLKQKMSRRDFFKMAGSALVGLAAGYYLTKLPKIKIPQPIESKPTVSVVKGPTEYSDDVVETVKKAVEKVNYLNKVLDSNSKVVLKPNLMYAQPAEKGTTTSGIVVKGVIEYLNELGIENITIAEGPCCATTINEVLQVTKIKPLLTKKIKYVDVAMTSASIADVPSPCVWKQMFVGDVFLDADMVISIPKLKTHCRTLFSMSLKNFVGSTPADYYAFVVDNSPFVRQKLHADGELQPQQDKIHGSIADINSVIQPKFAVVDGIIGVDGNSPFESTIKKWGVIAAGNDILAVDATIARLGGYDPNRIAHMKLFALKGLGKLEQSEIILVSDVSKLDITAPNFDLEFAKKYFRTPAVKKVSASYPYAKFETIEEWREVANLKELL
jgi:uncharacterized protein (DUF362 family)